MARSRKFVMISSVAERFDIHPQTLRLYEREGLLNPTRSEGNTRLYDDETLARLETILTLTRDMGVNLAGVEVILRLREQIEALAERVENLEDQLRERSAPTTRVRRNFALVRLKGGPLVKP
ncbi:MAG: MerR family transcriptional regulator [Acidobacteriota bacterium]|nr:MerR family transcriptional regulator [Acidobacteriota bacterium]